MSDEVSARTVKKTQELLGAVIKKPQLTEKLLKKPPFRFLHDIVHNVIKATKAFEGLYTPDELSSENVKEKEAKVGFLQKIIDAVVFASGASLSVRPSKIVAGHEPEKTNELLQTLAKVAQRKSDTKDAVQRVLAGEKPNKERGNKEKDGGTSSSKKDKKEKTSKLKDKDKDKEKSNGKRPSKDRETTKDDAAAAASEEKDSSIKERSSGSRSGRKRSSSSHRKKSPRPDGLGGPSDEQPGTADPISNGHTSNGHADDELLATKDEHKSDDNSIEIQHEPRPPALATIGGGSLDEGHGSENAPAPVPSAPPISNASSPITVGAGEAPADAPTPTENDLAAARALLRSARPGTSRRRPMSSLRGAGGLANDAGADGLGEEPTIRPMTARALANVIVDAPMKESEEDENDTFVQVNEEDGLSELHDGVPTAPEEAAVDEQEGMLVKQLLETKQQLERGGSGSGSRIQSPLVKESAYSARDLNAIERIREHIQGVSRGALPMGRLLDLLYEDLDSMLTEFSGWKEEYKRCDKDLRREMSRAEEALAPMQEELEQLDSEIGRESESIQLIKFDIQQAAGKLDKILDGFLAKV